MGQPTMSAPHPPVAFTFHLVQIWGTHCPEQGGLILLCPSTFLSQFVLTFWGAVTHIQHCSCSVHRGHSWQGFRFLSTSPPVLSLWSLLSFANLMIHQVDVLSGSRPQALQPRELSTCPLPGVPSPGTPYCAHRSSQAGLPQLEAHRRHPQALSGSKKLPGVLEVPPCVTVITTITREYNSWGPGMGWGQCCTPN